MEIKKFKASWIHLCLIQTFLFLLLPGCGHIPKIIFLHDPLSAEEHLQLGAAYESKGSIDLALAEYQAALEKSGEKKTVYFLIGNAYHQKGSYESAESFYRKAIREDPRFAAAYNNLAWNYWQWGRREEAREAVRRAVMIEPDRMEYQDTLQQIVGKETD